ncbi:MAG: hypothetical protein KDD34_01085 [Bdellovibrionales bacterium]|nr:hypothetical protein [Bdellovibrionales bacterium]
MNIRAVRQNDLQAILEFEKARLEIEVEDVMERELLSWKAPWRQEALEHYLNLGWSFGVWEDESENTLLGYVLAQPLLFFRGFTQTLWIEHLAANDKLIENQLIETVYQWSRDKHLQQMILPHGFSEHLKKWNPQEMSEGRTVVATSKMR